MTAYSESRLNPKTNEYSWRPMDFEIHTVAEFAALEGKFGFKVQDHPHLMVVYPRIVQSLSVESIAFVTGSTWRYTFVTADLSSVNVGNTLLVKNATNPLNNGAFEITAKGSDYVDVTSPDGVAQILTAGTAAIGGTPLSEIDSDTPSITQYSPDYRKATGRVFLHEDNAGDVYIVFYQGGGTVLGLDQWEALVQQIIDGMTLVGEGGGGLLNFVTNSNPDVDLASVGISSGAEFSLDRVTTAGMVLFGDASFYIEAGLGIVAEEDYVYFECSAIPLAYRNSSLVVEFAYKTWTDYFEGAARVVLFDGTRIIEPSVSVIPMGSGIFRAVFDSSGSSDPYQLWILAADGGPWNVLIGNVRVGPGVPALGPAITNGQAFTPTGSWSANTTYFGVKRRTGSFLRVDFLLKLSGAPTAANLTLNLPSGLSIDEDLLCGSGTDHVSVGRANCEGNAATTGYAADVYFTRGGTATQVKLGLRQDASRIVPNPVTNVNPFTWGNNDWLSGYYEVPIVNWGSSFEFGASVNAYVSNSDTSDANNAVDYVSGARGSLVPSVSTGSFYKEVELPRAYKHVWLEFQDSGSGNFMEVGSTQYARQEDFGTARYGALMIRQSDTKYRVYFCHAGYAQASNGGAVSWATAAGAGTRWRVVGSDNPLGVEIPQRVQRVAVEWQASSGTDNGGSTSGSWRDYDADAAATMTLINPNGFSWASIANGRVTLSPGRYKIDAKLPMYDAGSAKARLYDYTNSVVAGAGYVSGGLVGMSMYGTSGDDTTVVLPVCGELVVTSEIEIRLEYYCTAGGGTNRLGVAVGAGDIERYARIDIEKDS